ncbi:MAG TPA: hypothetical protein VF951_04880, partial [Streptosporangiaceae bacterium]
VGDWEPGMRFPVTQYRGVFERDLAISHELGAGRRVLSHAARDMLERELGPEAASRLIGCVERMAATAANTQYDA